ncbi:MAG: acyl--CoA ligase [bacterium]|nr:acyl--CoA ligase [bacterium]
MGIQEIEAQLTGPGGPFELAEEDVLGETQAVFRNRAGNLRELLAQSAERGDAEYIVYEDRRITFAQHARQVASVARALQERFDVRKGDRVAILAANCPEWIISYWAVTSLGAIAVGLNGWWAADEILYGLADSEPKLLIGDRKRIARLAGEDVGVPVVEMEAEFRELVQYAPNAELPETAIDEDDPASILYTSGTTGRPKGAVASHRNLIAALGLQFLHGLRAMLLAAERGIQASGPRRPTCVLVTSPLFHVSGLYTGALMMLASGSKTVWRSGRFDPVDVMRLVEKEEVTNWSPMGDMAHRVLNHPDLAKYDLSSLIGIGSGGAPLSADLMQRIRKQFPVAGAGMGTGYGLTESGAIATIAWADELEKFPATVGRPLPSVQVEIRDEKGRTLPDGREGEVCIRSPLIMLEYWRNPKATSETIGAGRWLFTGDVGRIEDGRLYINARARDLILRGAENIYPVEIEHRLEVHPDVEEAAVVGVDHPELGQEVKAFVVARAGVKLDTDALALFVGKTLATYKVPAHWELRDAPLPRNATGKVLKQVLAGEAENSFVAE